LRASVAAGADVVHTVLTNAAGIAVVSFAAGTVEAAIAFTAEHGIVAVFADFTAILTDNRTFGTAVAAVTDVLSTVFTRVAVFAEITFASDTFTADIASAADGAFLTVFTDLTAFSADDAAFRTGTA